MFLGFDLQRSREPSIGAQSFPGNLGGLTLKTLQRAMPPRVDAPMLQEGVFFHLSCGALSSQLKSRGYKDNIIVHILIPDSTRASRWRKFLLYKTYRTPMERSRARPFAPARRFATRPLFSCFAASSQAGQAGPSHHLLAEDRLLACFGGVHVASLDSPPAFNMA